MLYYWQLTKGVDKNTCDERNEHKYHITSALGMTQICSANKTGGRQRSWYKWSKPGGPEVVAWPDNVACVFVFLGNIIICRLYKLTLSDQAQVTATDFSN